MIKVIIRSIIICSECRGGEKCPAAGERIHEVGESVSIISERDFLEAAGSRFFGVGPRFPLLQRGEVHDAQRHGHRG